jgi:8-oxo-dGTP pyrophosphatase MutT (NUDIX family)
MTTRPLTLHDISRILDRQQAVEYDVPGRTHASVAMILRELCDDLELLFIERAHDARDPWSGHLAFPGGKVEQDEMTRQAAERETLEEIGLDLSSAFRLGRLSDITGANLPVRVSCHVFGITPAFSEPAVSAEVQDVFWVRLADLGDQQRHVTATVGFSGIMHQVPAIVLPVSGKPVLWGITYRLVMEFLERIGRV